MNRRDFLEVVGLGLGANVFSTTSRLARNQLIPLSLEKLTSISDVKVGDLYPTNAPIVMIPTLTMVDEVNPENNYFHFCSLDERYSGWQHPRRLESAVFLRPSKKGLTILAGEKAYKILTNPPQETRVPQNTYNGSPYEEIKKRPDDNSDTHNV